MSNEYLTTTAGATVLGLTIAAGETLLLRCYSTAGSSDVRINACRVDCREDAPSGEDADTSVLQGQALIDADQIEARIGAGVWAGITGFANALELGNIAALGYTEFEIRTTIPSGISAFALAVRALI